MSDLISIKDLLQHCNATKAGLLGGAKRNGDIGDYAEAAKQQVRAQEYGTFISWLRSAGNERAQLEFAYESKGQAADGDGIPTAHDGGTGVDWGGSRDKVSVTHFPLAPAADRGPAEPADAVGEADPQSLSGDGFPGAGGQG